MSSPVNQFIEIAPDCKLDTAVVPQEKNGRPSIATIEYELLSGRPYGYTLEELKFAKPCACMRASPLTKQYGWGAHYDERGRIALYAVESEEYRRFVNDKNVKKFFAMRSKRGGK